MGPIGKCSPLERGQVQSCSTPPWTQCHFSRGMIWRKKNTNTNENEWITWVQTAQHLKHSKSERRDTTVSWWLCHLTQSPAGHFYPVILVIQTSSILSDFDVGVAQSSLSLIIELRCALLVKISGFHNHRITTSPNLFLFCFYISNIFSKVGALMSQHVEYIHIHMHVYRYIFYTHIEFTPHANIFQLDIVHEQILHIPLKHH